VCEFAGKDNMTWDKVVLSIAIHEKSLKQKLLDATDLTPRVKPRIYA